MVTVNYTYRNVFVQHRAEMGRLCYRFRMVPTEVVLVVQNDVGNRYSPTTIIVPLSRRKPRLPTHVVLSGFELYQPSTALCNQVRTVDIRRLIRLIGHVDDDTVMAQVDKAIVISLGLNRLLAAC